MAVVAKTCTRCRRSVPIWLKAGDKCPHCGIRFAFETQPPGRRVYEGVSFGTVVFIVLLLAFVVTGVWMPKYAEQAFLRKTREGLLGSPEQSLAAARSLSGKKYDTLRLLGPAYIEAMTKASPPLRAELIKNLGTIRGQRQNAALPFAFLNYVKAAQNDSDAGVREAAAETLQTMGESR